MAEYANDIIEETDIIAATGATAYTVKISGHATLTPGQRATLRTAAQDGGWSGLRSAWNGIDDRAGAWLDTLDSAGQTAMLRTVKRALLPAS